jgi:hypothetical protein
MLEGNLKGDASIDWSSGWRAKGTLVGQAIAVQNLGKGMTGEMEGSARFQMLGTNLTMLTDSATLEGTFSVKNGVINGIDILETARSRIKDSSPGGRTRFDKLSGVLTVSTEGVAIRQMKISADDLSVSGVLDIDKQQLSGKISADLSQWGGKKDVTMKVAGTTDNPVLREAP